MSLDNGKSAPSSLPKYTLLMGQVVTPELVGHLSPYIRDHIRRFGRFVLDTDQIPELGVSVPLPPKVTA